MPKHISDTKLRVAIVCFAILLRLLVGIHPHSGQADYQGSISNHTAASSTQKYGGDYEAQRHWMEITLHLPLSEWYFHDLKYWGLDYPPLTAYTSYFFGWLAHKLGSLSDDHYEIRSNNDTCQWDNNVCINHLNQTITESKKMDEKRNGARSIGVLKDMVALYSSRFGFEDSGGKLYMRLTVLLMDLLVYISAVCYLVDRLTDEGRNNSHNHEKNDSRITERRGSHRHIWPLSVALLQPALILIDHGHFQYNTVSLGLALWSFHFMTLHTNPFNKNRPSFIGPILGSVLFCLALNFKQMELYHAPAVFAYLLGRCFHSHSYDAPATVGTLSTVNGVKCVPSNDNSFVTLFGALAMTVIITFSILWFPFAVFQRDSIQSIVGIENSKIKFHLAGVKQIVKRLFPFERGLFEGKVSNVWCALSIKPFSIRSRIPIQLLPWLALGLTLMLIVPACSMLFLAGKGGRDSADTKVNNRLETLTRKQRQLRQYQKPKDRELQDIKLLLWGSASTSLAFFLASFQVHEKGILIPLAPLSLLAIDAPRFISWFSIVATWSLWHLIVIDRLQEAYLCCLVIFLSVIIISAPSSTQLISGNNLDIFSYYYPTRHFVPLSSIIMILLHMIEFTIIPPKKLPDLFPVLWSVVGCGFFCFSYLVTIWAMSCTTRFCRTLKR